MYVIDCDCIFKSIGDCCILWLYWFVSCQCAGMRRTCLQHLCLPTRVFRRSTASFVKTSTFSYLFPSKESRQAKRRQPRKYYLKGTGQGQGKKKTVQGCKDLALSAHYTNSFATALFKVWLVAAFKDLWCPSRLAVDQCCWAGQAGRCHLCFAEPCNFQRGMVSNCLWCFWLTEPQSALCKHAHRGQTAVVVETMGDKKILCLSYFNLGPSFSHLRIFNDF